MENKKDTFSSKKPSLLKKIVGFTKSDENYQPEIQKEIKVQPVETKKLSSRWRNIKAALFVLGIFYLLLCAFILLNPQFALFFNNIFGIEYVTVQFILQYTIYVFYSIFGIFLGAFFLFFWYRSIVIRTHKRGKRIVLWWATLSLGVLFFANMLLYALTYAWFQSIDFTNLNERVILYDNTLLGYKRSMPDKKMPFFQIPRKAIWPLSVRYDISPQIKKIVRENGILLNRGYSFKIDYNQDGEFDTGSGDNPNVELPITNLESPVLVPGEFKEAGQYKTKATLTGIDAAGNKKEIDVEMPDILVQNIVDVSYKDSEDGSKIYIFDATSLTSIGQARWSILDNPGSEYAGYQFSPRNITKYPAIVCLKMQPMDIGTTDMCDWRFVIGENIQTNITQTEIQFKVDTLDPLKYQFSIDPKFWQGQVKKIIWKVDGKVYAGKFISGTEMIFDYTFKTSGTYLIEAEIEDTLGNIVTTSTEPIFTALFTELKSGYTLKVFDENGADISKGTYNDRQKTYFLPDEAIPSVLTFDAIGVQSIDARLRLKKVEWDMDNDGVYEKNALKYSHELSLPEQYTFYARYTFEDKEIDGTIKPQIQIHKIVVKGIQKPIDVRVKIRADHDYAPALVYFDATGSRVQQGEIIKFLYDFWDGSKVYEWEGIAEYRYKTAGEYRIRVTAVTKDGKRATQEYILIVKKPQESIKIEPSVLSENAQAGFLLTFNANTQGVTQSITWNFGDNSPPEEGESIIHTFQAAGIYTITARALYESGIEKSATLLYTVK